MKRQNPQPAKGGAWSYIAGEKGRNRVRVFQQAARGPIIYIDYRADDGARVKKSLGHSDRERAKLEADDIAAKFGRTESRPPAAITLSRLFDIYEKEVTPKKAAGTQAHDRRTFKLFVQAFGSNRRVETLNVRDWDSYIARRRSGELACEGREGKHVRAQIIAHDMKLLRAILNWAARAGDGRGGYLLERNPVAGLPIPREESPKRPVLSREQFAAMMQAARKHSTQAECFVALAWYTGHRSKSIRYLRWSDIDFEGARIHWRGESDKIEYDHWNPVHANALLVLSREREIIELMSGKPVGDAWVFPSPRTKGELLSREFVAKLWNELAAAAKVPKRQGFGWHAFRRAFANALRDAPLRDLKDLGGWKTERTVVGTYLQPDEAAQRRALTRFVGGPSNGREDGPSESERDQ